MDGNLILHRIQNYKVVDDWIGLQRDLLTYINDPYSPKELVDKLKGYTEMVAIICEGIQTSEKSN